MLYMCVCVRERERECLCVTELEREREREREVESGEKEVCTKVFLRKTNIFLRSERKRLF